MPQENLPDPSGEPQPVTVASKLLTLLKYASITAGVVGVGGFLILPNLLRSRVCGARHSAQLQWKDRQHQMERAAENARQTPVTPTIPNER
jgi:hypothetical protein